MEGLIPLILKAVKKQVPRRVYRSLSENSVTGRSYHLLIAGDAAEGSSHRRTNSGYQPTPLAYQLDGDNGLRQRAVTSAGDYKVSGMTNKFGQ
ncbi:hypothetical protein OROGR_020599 [Orobanche gracilis]